MGDGFFKEVDGRLDKFSELLRGEVTVDMGVFGVKHRIIGVTEDVGVEAVHGFDMLVVSKHAFLSFFFLVAN